DSSAYTAIDTLHTLVETCFPPKDITITAAWDTAVVKWIGEAGTYKLRYGKKGDENVVTETVSGDEYVLKGLTPETTYVVAMQSICSETDESLWSEDVEFTTTAIPECVTPTNLAVGSITYESAVLTWDADESNLRWNIHFRKGSDAAWTTVEGLTEKSYTINNLDANESYIWSVMAECEAQNSTWATQNRFQTVVNAIESATLGKPQVFVRGGIVNVVNSERGYIESVSIYNEAGQLLKVCDAKTNDNLFIPVGTASQSMLIVKVKGSDKTFTVKLKR
ncbi:MAG: fibronectin type III domain-containing protein, partial [Prevotella sp.]